MNSPGRVIGFVNAAHFIDHYSMLIFAAAVIVMGPALGMAYSELLPYATPGFIAFGAGSLLTGWLGDRWSRRHMMVIFFSGIGASMIAVGLVQTPLQQVVTKGSEPISIQTFVAWRIVDPVLKDPTPVREYEPNSWGPSEVDLRVSPVGGWQNPVVAG